MAYITLEEFTSSTSPLPTILVPRSQAARLVELCELAEMTPTAGFLDFIGIGGDSDGETPSTSTSNIGGNGNAKVGGDNNANPHVLVTQMALLLYLGEYTHARHLWRRHRDTASPPSSSTTTTSENGRTNGNAGNIRARDGDLFQLELLWNAARYIYLWSTGGVHSMTTSNNGLLSAPDDDGNGRMMQVEEENEENDSSSDNGNLPFSTLALRALESCRSLEMEPLATYAAELVGVFRSRVNRLLQRSFVKLDRDEFCVRMNLERGSGGGEVWNAFGWKEIEGGYLVSDANNVVVLDDEDCLMEEVTTGKKEEDRIGKLTDIVMFLEGKMNA